jgi:hypothetical protein
LKSKATERFIVPKNVKYIIITTDPILEVLMGEIENRIEEKKNEKN